MGLSKVMDATIDSVKKYGVVLSLNGDLTGFASTEQIKGVACTAGLSVRCRVLDIDAEKGIVDVTLRCSWWCTHGLHAQTPCAAALCPLGKRAYCNPNHRIRSAELCGLQA